MEAPFKCGSDGHLHWREDRLRVLYFRLTCGFMLALLLTLCLISSSHGLSSARSLSAEKQVQIAQRYLGNQASYAETANNFPVQSNGRLINFSAYVNLNSSAGSAVAWDAYRAGFLGNNLVEMVAIAYPESRWGLYNYTPGSSYQGMWQMSAGDESQVGVIGDLGDPQVNADTAYLWWEQTPGIDPAGYTLPAPDLSQLSPVASEYGQGYLPGTKFSPWTDFGRPALPLYQAALAFTNANIASWGLPGDWATPDLGA